MAYIISNSESYFWRKKELKGRERKKSEGEREN